MTCINSEMASPYCRNTKQVKLFLYMINPMARMGHQLPHGRLSVQKKILVPGSYHWRSSCLFWECAQHKRLQNKNRELDNQWSRAPGLLHSFPTRPASYRGRSTC